MIDFIKDIINGSAHDQRTQYGFYKTALSFFEINLFKCQDDIGNQFEKDDELDGIVYGFEQIKKGLRVNNDIGGYGRG